MKLYKVIALVAVGIFMSACSSVPMQDEGSKAEYTSKLDNESGILHGVNVGKMANGAPLRIVAMVHTEQPPEKAWTASLADIDKWSGGQITKVTYHEGSFNGKLVDADMVKAGHWRQCANEENGDLLVETIDYISHDKRMYVYSVDFEKSNLPFPIENHTGAVTVESDGKGGSLLTFRAYFDRTWNPMALIFPPIFRGEFNKFMANFADEYGGTVINAKFNQ